MNEGRFAAYINISASILRKSNLLLEYIPYPSYPNQAASLFRRMSYLEIWETSYTNRYFHFMLSDFSLIHFRLERTPDVRLNYSYLECPVYATPYEEFLEEVLDLRYDEVRDELRQEYEQEVATFPPKENVTPIRYDYDPTSYTPGMHPASHIHFGHNSDVRVRTERILNPISFILFIIRQYYVNRWSDLCKLSDTPLWCRNIRQSLDEVDDQFQNDIDQWEFILA